MDGGEGGGSKNDNWRGLQCKERGRVSVEGEYGGRRRRGREGKEFEG